MPTKEIWLDRLYLKGRSKAAGAVSAKVGDKMTNLLAIGPDLAYLLVRLIFDPDVTGGRKLDFAVSLAYLFLPIDIVPDKWPLLGKIDDVYVVLSAIARMLRNVDEDVLLRYWQGHPEALRKARKFLVALDEKLGSGLTAKVLRFVEKAAASAVPA